MTIRRPSPRDTTASLRAEDSEATASPTRRWTRRWKTVPRSPLARSATRGGLVSSEEERVRMNVRGDAPRGVPARDLQKQPVSSVCPLMMPTSSPAEAVSDGDATRLRRDVKAEGVLRRGSPRPAPPLTPCHDHRSVQAHVMLVPSRRLRSALTE